MIVGSAYLVEYNTADDMLIAKYEFEYIGKRRARDVFDYAIERYRRYLNDPNESETGKSNAQWALDLSLKQQKHIHRMYVERPMSEQKPPEDLLNILNKSIKWESVSIGHPWGWE